MHATGTYSGMYWVRHTLTSTCCGVHYLLGAGSQLRGHPQHSSATLLTSHSPNSKSEFSTLHTTRKAWRESVHSWATKLHPISNDMHGGGEYQCNRFMLTRNSTWMAVNGSAGCFKLYEVLRMSRWGRGAVCTSSDFRVFAFLSILAAILLSATSRVVEYSFEIYYTDLTITNRVATSSNC